MTKPRVAADGATKPAGVAYGDQAGPTRCRREQGKWRFSGFARRAPAPVRQRVPGRGQPACGRLGSGAPRAGGPRACRSAALVADPVRFEVVARFGAVTRPGAVPRPGEAALGGPARPGVRAPPCAEP